MSQKILIIGGYGAVGSQIARYLAPLYPHNVIVSGRNYAKAEKTAEQLSHGVIPLRLDLDKFEDESILDDVRLVIVCLDSPHTRLVKACIERGILYLDISAQYESLKQIEELNHAARSRGAAIVLSTGLAPGLTNLLAQLAHDRLKSTTSINIFVLLGLGEKHGEQAYRWTFNHIAHRYQVGKEAVNSFTSPVRTDLLGVRKFYTFDFSDQHVISNTLPQVKVRTRMAFDLGWFTRLTSVLRKVGIARMFRNKTVQDVAIKAFSSYSLGSDVFAVKVVAKDSGTASASYSFTGNNEGKVTAVFAAEMARYLLDQPELPAGVWHTHQLVRDIPRFVHNIQQYDPSFRFTENPDEER